MENREILENLCYYDKRNPENVVDDYTEEEIKAVKSKGCHCDNCFYGNTVIAEELVKVKGL